MTESLETAVARLEGLLEETRRDNQRLLRAVDALEIQNVMSWHELYHMVGNHADEVDAIWAQKTPGLAMEEAVLRGRYEGLEAVRRYYVDFFKSFDKTMLEEVRRLYPQVETEPDADRPFGVRLIHTLTTPLIEVAEDRQTAKGVWMSPGLVTAPAGGKLQAFWHWDRYAIDFIREEGKWKIWHFWVGKEFSTPYDRSWVDDFFQAPGVSLENVPGFPKPNAPSMTDYRGYNPFEAAQWVPRPPEPYRTFSETFSY